jgi:cytochrome c5
MQGTVNRKSRIYAKRRSPPTGRDEDADDAEQHGEMPSINEMTHAQVRYSVSHCHVILSVDRVFDFQRVTVSKSESSDTQFFNSFSLVLGVLIFFAIVLFVFARNIGADTQGKDVLLDPLHLKEVQSNIQPFGQVAIAGQDNSALVALTASKTEAPAADIPTTGEQAFTKVCSACHAAGINGAPKIGDHAAWGPRIAQGKEVLYQHAIGGKGNMPARGGTTWPDATIRMAVDYMVSLNK